MNASQITASTLARRRHQPNPVVLALLSFGISEEQVGAQLGLSGVMVSGWKTGRYQVDEKWLPELYGLLREFLDAKQATISLLKKQGQWDRQMSRLLRDRFAEATKVYSNRPRWVKELEQEQDQDVA